MERNIYFQYAMILSLEASRPVSPDFLPSMFAICCLGNLSDTRLIVVTNRDAPYCMGGGNKREKRCMPFAKRHFNAYPVKSLTFAGFYPLNHGGVCFNAFNIISLLKKSYFEPSVVVFMLLKL